MDKPSIPSLVAISIAIIIYLCFWAWAIYLLIEHGQQMPNWAVIVSIVGLVAPIPGGFLISIILSLVSRK